jgi:uncharacterized alkaline shock family protein YloU
VTASSTPWRGCGAAAVADDAADDTADDGAGARGTLTIRQRAVARIALAACLEAPGVRRHGSGLGKIAGRELPRAEVDVAGDRVRASVDVAVEWGRSLSAVAADVGRGVGDALASHSGLTVDGVTVHVAAIIPPGTGHDATRKLS